MCGRYLLTSPPDAVARQFGVDVRDNFPARYNIAPTQPVATVRNGYAGREYALQRWGFILPWAKEVSGQPLINARAETAAEKPAFRSAFRRRRCLVPADGFYEWRMTHGAKEPWCVRRTDKTLFAFAALWDTWESPDGSEIDACAILTAAAGADLARIYPREPIVIPQTDYDAWLDHSDERADMARFLAAQPRGSWTAWQVSRGVGAVANEGAALIEPAARQLTLL